MGTAYDMRALKAYVEGPSSQNKADDTVLLNVSHSNLKQRFMELRFDLHVSVPARQQSHVAGELGFTDCLGGDSVIVPVSEPSCTDFVGSHFLLP